MLVEIDSISYNCSSERGPLLAILIRGGNLGPSGLASTPSGGFTPWAFGGAGVAAPLLAEVVLTVLSFFLFSMLEIGLLVEVLAPMLLLACPQLWSECCIQCQQCLKISQCEVYQTICDRVMHRYTRWTCRLSHQTSNLSHPCNPLPKGCVLCFTWYRVQGDAGSDYTANIKQLKSYWLKVPHKGLGTCIWINKTHSSFWLCSAPQEAPR